MEVPRHEHYWSLVVIGAHTQAHTKGAHAERQLVAHAGAHVGACWSGIEDGGSAKEGERREFERSI